MKKYSLIILAILFLSTTGCKKWFDVIPKTEMKGDALFSTEAGFRDALIGVYALMTQPASYGSELTMAYLDVLAQTYDNTRTTSGHSYLKAADFDYKEAGEEKRLEKIWKQEYKAIVNTNIILQKAEENRSIFKGKNFNIIKGEALGLRAFLHFDLLRMFGHAPLEGLNQKAIPYANAYTNVPFKQSTSLEVISFIITDLNNARELMKDSDPYSPSLMKKEDAGFASGNRNVRMNYYAITALMARVYLYAGEKEKALIKAKEVIDSGLFPPFSSGSGVTDKKNYIFPSEQIFSLTITDLKTRYSDRFFPEVGNNASPTSLTMRNTTLLTIFPAGLDTDYRNNWFETSTSSTKRLSKYSYNTIIPLIKISEMYLIAAEAEPVTSIAVKKYLNVLKVHRGLSELDAQTTSDVLLKTEIKNEYRREFIGEGQLFYYYKRLNEQKFPTLPQFSNSSQVYNLPIPSIEIEFGNIE